MSNNRNLADLLDANGDVSIAALDNVPPNTALVDSSDNTVLNTANGSVDITGSINSTGTLNGHKFMSLQKSSQYNSITPAFVVSGWGLNSQVIFSVTGTYNSFVFGYTWSINCAHSGHLEVVPLANSAYGSGVLYIEYDSNANMKISFKPTSGASGSVSAFSYYIQGQNPCGITEATSTGGYPYVYQGNFS